MKADKDKYLQYKAIISDFDGTLAGYDFIISDKVKEAIERWRSKKKVFSIATGKAFKEKIDIVCKVLNLSDPIIVNAGAQIINPKTKKVIYAEYIFNDEAKKIINLLNKNSFFYEVQTEKDLYASNETLKKIYPHKNYADIKKIKIDKIAKIRIVVASENQAKVNQFINKLKSIFKNLHIIRANSPYSKGVDITSEKASKHLAVLQLSKFLNIKPQEIIGIGDEINDYPLLTACGYKVAMENSPRELKEIADYIAPSYQKDGVAVFINKILCF